KEGIGYPVPRRGRIENGQFFLPKRKIKPLAALQYHADFMIHGPLLQVSIALARMIPEADALMPIAGSNGLPLRSNLTTGAALP
ncbi:MAG: hypothetical protein IT512_02635, partial [Rhodocyclaceae bacterium]|nr:hypothetical protein [Rhodocyclaceae bacterium]